MRCSLAIIALLCLISASALAQEVPPAPATDDAAPQPSAPSEPDALEPEQIVTGIEVPERRHDEVARDVGNIALWLPRNVIDYTFRGATTAASLVADEQLVPRYRDAVGAPRDGYFWVFPTLFVDTGSAFSVGARMIIDTAYVAASQRVAFGGPSDIVSESRVLFKGGGRIPYVVSLEAYYEIESEIEYHGVGITPEDDPRNVRRAGRSSDIGLYSEKHARGLGSLGLRLAPPLEFFLSASMARRQTRDSDGAGGDSLSRVFDVDRAPIAGFNPSGTEPDTSIGYAEMAVRFDSRRYRGRPSPGALLEGYTGGAHSIGGDPVAFMRFGWRAAGFLPIYRKTNILSPRVVVDRLLPLGRLPVPFNELPRQPEYRGFDTRRDLLSIVTSLDYSWQLVSFMGTRLFFDMATVSEGVQGLSLEQLKNLRFAGGAGIDFYTDSTLIAQFALSGSADGARLLLTVGAPEGFGDRQHRD